MAEMASDFEIRKKGLRVLFKNPGEVDAMRFLSQLSDLQAGKPGIIVRKFLFGNGFRYKLHGKCCLANQTLKAGI